MTGEEIRRNLVEFARKMYGLHASASFYVIRTSGPHNAT